jgi:hypothetical protein
MLITLYITKSVSRHIVSMAVLYSVTICHYISEVLKAVSSKHTVFWYVALCSQVKVYDIWEKCISSIFMAEG